MENLNSEKTEKIQDETQLKLIKTLYQDSIIISRLRYAKYTEKPKYEVKPQDNGFFSEIKGCFANSARYLMTHHRESEIVYYEGFYWDDFIPLPLPHAWLEIDGKLFDPTLREKQEKRIYYGVKIKTQELLRVITNSGFFGYFDSLQKIKP